MGTLMNWNLEVYFCTQAVFKGADCISLKQQLLDNGKENWISSSSNETGEMLIRLGGVECKDIIELVKYLKSIKESIISNQIGRSGTSIGANIHEAQYAQGKKDFISKLEIALKEASETGYWLELLLKTKYIDEFCRRIKMARYDSYNDAGHRRIIGKRDGDSIFGY